ncbi:MAG: ATP-binding cassette domain-containing protein, partial [Aquihabitans sp.]
MSDPTEPTSSSGPPADAVDDPTAAAPLPPEAAAHLDHPDTDRPVLMTATDLVAGYLPGVDILNGASLELRQGELVGIIGPNGAGKSTLIKTLFGLVPVRSGTVVLDGEDITSKPAHELVAQGVGYVPQTKNVFPSLTIEENLRMGIFLDPSRFDDRFE